MKLAFITATFALSLATLMVVGPTFAQSHADHSHTQTPGVAPLATHDLADGEVRRIDRPAGKLTIRHGEIKRLEMPPMTMVFSVADPGLMNNLKGGDKIRFAVERQSGRMVITRILPAS